MSVKIILRIFLLCLVFIQITGVAGALSLTEIGKYDGSVSGVVVAGNYAYGADYGNGLVIIDISNPAAPRLAGSYDGWARSALGVAVSGSYAYVAAANNGFMIVDISNPVAPKFAGSYDTAGSAYDIAISGSYAYVASSNGLVVIDISNPAAPTFAGSYDTAEGAVGVAVSGSYAYVAASTNGLVIVDISNPAAPVLAGSYDTTGYALDVAVSGSYAYFTDSDKFVIVDISNPAAPKLAGSYNAAGSETDVAVSGSYAYVATRKNGFVIIDISNPTVPTLAGSYNTAGYASGTGDVAVSGSYAYVASSNGLVIYNINNSAAPALVDIYNTADKSDESSSNIFKIFLYGVLLILIGLVATIRKKSKPKERPISTHGKQCVNHINASATAICHKCDKLLCNDCALHHRDGHPYCKDCWDGIISTKIDSTAPKNSVIPFLNKSPERISSIKKSEIEKSWKLPIVEPEPAQQNTVAVPASVQSSTIPVITSAFGYKGATIQYKVKVENPTSEPIADIKVNLYVPDVFLSSESTKSIAMLKPSESKTVTFEIRPTGECGDCEVSGRVIYYDYSAKKTTEVEIPAKSLSIVCPMLKGKEISKSEWHGAITNLVMTEESTKDIDMSAKTLFEMTSRIVKDMNMHQLEPEMTDSSQLFNGVARFYGVGVKGLKYAAQVEVVGGAKKSRLILKTWAEKEEALTGFYHGLLDEIEKRVHVKGYIDDSIVQNFHHYGDKIGTQVKDSIVQRSNIGTGAGEKECSNCNTVVDAGSEFCNKCGEKLNL